MKNLLLICFSLAIGLHAQAQATLTYQGIIKNADGTAVENGKYPITFKLYDMESGGTPVWDETQPEVKLTGGIYSVVLGEVTPLNVPFDAPYYLGIAVDGGAELIPRTRLTAAPYALSLLGNSNVFPNDGNVGVGTIAPEEKLHVIGNLKIEGDLEVSGTIPSDIDLSNLTEDINTTGNISLGNNEDVVSGEGQLYMVAGVINADATIARGTGFTVTRPPNTIGLYLITFDKEFSSQPVITGSPRLYGHHFHDYTSDTNHITNPNKQAKVVIIGSNHSTGALSEFSFIAVGPR